VGLANAKGLKMDKRELMVLVVDRWFPRNKADLLNDLEHDMVASAKTTLERLLLQYEEEKERSGA